MRGGIVVAAFATVAMLAGCSGVAQPAQPVEERGGTLNWTDREGAFRFSNGWIAEFCEGDGPFVCVRDGDATLGAMELLDLPAEGRDPRAHADEFLDVFAADRASGCPDHAFAPMETTAADLGGHDALRYGFHLTDAAGTEVERVVKYVAAVDGRLVVFGANATDPDGCMGGGIGEFTPADLDAVDGELDALAAAMRLAEPAAGGPEGPPDAAMADGGHTAFVRAFRSGEVDVDPAEMLTGEQARQAAQADGQLEPGEDLPNDFYIDDPEATVLTMPVADDVSARLFDCTRECELAAVDYDDLVDGGARAMNGPQALYHVTVADGVVTAVEEIYFP